MYGETHGGFPKLGGTFLRLPVIRIRVYWGLYWDPTILRNYHLGKSRECSLFGKFLFLQLQSIHQTNYFLFRGTGFKASRMQKISHWRVILGIPY